MIEFQFFEGCPNSQATLENLRSLIAEGVVDERNFSILEIKNPEEASLLNFQGSPSILVEGIDIYTGEKPATASYSCRSYVIDGKRTGVLSKDYLKKRLLELARLS